MVWVMVCNNNVTQTNRSQPSQKITQDNIFQAI